MRYTVGERIEAAAWLAQDQEPFEGQMLDGKLVDVQERPDGYALLAIRSDYTGRLWLVEVDPEGDPIEATLAEGEPEIPAETSLFRLHT